MKYLLIISHDDDFVPTGELIADVGAWEAEMGRRGIRESGSPLRPAGEAVTVRVREDIVVRTPGPATDSPDQMAAYELVACADIEDAVQVASLHPMARAGTIEVRPVWEELAEG